MQWQKTDSTSVFVTRLMNDLEPTLFDFIKTNVNSFIKWDLLKLFYANRELIDTAENVAKYTGRPVAMIEPELADLVESELIVKTSLTGIPVYALTSDEIIWASISNFISACEDREMRMKFVYHIVHEIQ
ncbi:MAG: hypothetical protein HC875_05415 [Anaerolineales bacterium]|nr:hypothetical protein [Anaerolineales bacterium]